MCLLMVRMRLLNILSSLEKKQRDNYYGVLEREKRDKVPGRDFDSQEHPSGVIKYT
jgi:hypothetical protein